MADDLLAAAWQLPVASIYGRTRLEWQKARWLCGPTSVANALRSFGAEVDRATLLDGMGLTTFFGFRLGGLTLDQLAEIVRAKSPRRATVLRDLDADAFRGHLELANDPARRYLVNFDRAPILGWGGGHHSPLGGYLTIADRALVLDVNRRVGPWLASAERLFAAVSTIDRSSRQRRGLLLIE